MRTILALSAASLILALACGGVGTLEPSEEPLVGMRPDHLPRHDAKAEHLEDLLQLEDQAAIDARFGEAVSTVEIFENEAGTFEHPAIHAGTPREVVFYNKGVMTRRPDSEWTSTTGLRGGLTLAELETVNGGPVSLQGTPDGLQVTDFRGGSLDGKGLSIYYGKDGDLYPELEGVDDFESVGSDTLHDAGLTLHTLYVY